MPDDSISRDSAQAGAPGLAYVGSVPTSGTATGLIIPASDSQPAGFAPTTLIDTTYAPAEAAPPQAAVVASDGIVSGTMVGELIDENYTGDPDGDRVSEGDDTIMAGDGNDSIYATLGDDLAYGDGGDDFLSGGFGDDTLYGGDGDDTLNGDEGNDDIYGGAGNDHSEMGTGNDTFHGGDGDDWVNGDYGNDLIFGGAGDDFLRGSFGNDTIWSGGAGEGDDYLWGGYNDDLFIIQNGFGNDSISGEDQAETLGDTLDLTRVTDDLVLDLTHVNPGIGTFTDGVGLAEYNGIEHIILGAGNDTIVLADLGGADRVEGFSAPTDNGDGTFSATDRLDVSALTRDSGDNPVTVEDVSVSDDGAGNAVLSFPGGESLTLIGVSPAQLNSPAALIAIGIPPAPDGIVSGTGGDDAISWGYTDDDGDMLDGNDARLPGETGNDDIIEAGAGNDTVNAGFGDDEVDAGSGDDSVEGWAGDDVILGGDGDDTLAGQDGNDILRGDDGDDVLTGGEGNDLLVGGAGGDNLRGDLGDDTLAGDDGNDTLAGGAGADLLKGGADRDTFTDLTMGDTVDGGEAGDDFDVLDLTGAGPYRVHHDPANSENGTIDFLSDAGDVLGTLTFRNIEQIVPCFTPGTLIATAAGEMPVEELREGMRVITRDHGYRRVAWIGRRQVAADWLARAPHLAPIRIARGALGNGLPERDLLVSPNHRMLLAEPAVITGFGEPEVLVAAKHLVGRPGITRAPVRQVTYLHLLFESHEIIRADGAWSESFHPGEHILGGLGDDQRAEILTLFPQLRDATMPEGFALARTVLRRHEAALLLRG